ncbi:PspC domain-containing protein [Paradesertivirga mongoliensis]|uniref:PspC domain-containing protein n=1 Tax=Paradesertivirga mongoliensis TaxID=2100740 RepID=A0ABW4ZFP5_9SPHI|nr:PspC domain-containing protein [Pedobacter mongoliensis]
MERKLERNQQNKMIAGVASGLADYFETDANLMRVLFICAAVFGFSGILIYIILWIAVPEKPFFQNFQGFEKDYKSGSIFDATYNSTESSSGPAETPKESPYNAYTRATTPPPLSVRKQSDSGRILAGLCLIAVGAYFMLAELNVIPHWFSIFKLWPVILIVLGFVIIAKSGKKKPLEKPPVMNWDSPKDSESTKADVDDKPLSP